MPHFVISSFGSSLMGKVAGLAKLDNLLGTNLALFLNMRSAKTSQLLLKFILAFSYLIPQYGKAAVTPVNLEKLQAPTQDSTDFLVASEIQISATGAFAPAPYNQISLASSTIRTFFITDESQFEAVLKRLNITSDEVALYLLEKGDRTGIAPLEIPAREPSQLNFLGSFMKYLKAKMQHKIVTPYRISLKHLEEEATRYERFSKFFDANHLITLTAVVSAFSFAATTTSLFMTGGLRPLGPMLLGVYSALIAGGYILFNKEFLDHIGNETRPEKWIYDKIGLARDGLARAGTVAAIGLFKNIFQVININVAEELLFLSLAEHAEGFSIAKVAANAGGDFLSAAGLEMFLSSTVDSFSKRFPEKRESMEKLASLTMAAKEVVAQALIAASYAGSHSCQIALYALGGVGFALYFGEMGFRAVQTRLRSGSAAGSIRCEAVYMGM